MIEALAIYAAVVSTVVVVAALIRFTTPLSVLRSPPGALDPVILDERLEQANGLPTQVVINVSLDGTTIARHVEEVLSDQRRRS